MKSFYILSTLLLSTLLSYSQTISYYESAYFKYGGDSIWCKRAAPSDLQKLREIDMSRMRDSDDREYGLFYTDIISIEELLNQKQAGVSGFELAFSQLMEKLKYLSIKYKLLNKHKIDLSLSNYEMEFAFYQNHHIKSKEEIQRELNDEVLRRNDSLNRVNKLMEYKKRAKDAERLDSLEEADEKQRLYYDSIENKNQEKRQQRQIEADKIRQKKLSEDREKEAKENAKKIEAKRQELIAKYGATKASLIFNKKVEIGWTKEMCIESWGKPREINKTTTALVEHEQWVYGIKRYLYFEKGILTAIQE